MNNRASSFGKRAPAVTRAASMAQAAAVAVPVVQEVSDTRAPTFIARLPWFTAALCIVLIVRYAAELSAATDFSAPGAPGHFSLLALGALSRDLVVGQGEWWRLFTATALHGSASHLIGNLIALAAAGILLEPIIGIGWFAAIYFVGALAGALMSMMVNPPDMLGVGASGAIMATLAATYCLSFHDGTVRPALMRKVAGGLLFPALLPAVADGGGIVDVSAHFGGAVAGTALAFAVLISWPDRTDTLPGRGLAAGIAGMLLAATVAAFLASSFSFDRYAEKGHDYIPAEEMPKNAKEMSARSLALADKYPKDPRAHFFRGLYFLDQNNLHDAEPRLREAIRLGEANKGVMSPYFLNWAKTALALDVKGLNRPAEAATIAAPLCKAGNMEKDWLRYLREEDLCPG
jgi:membrane associated rhomboid family serine protease